MFDARPKTVAQAVAPFKKVQAGLAAVIETATATRQDAERKISEAEVAKETAAAEAAQAEKIMAALASIVGEN